MIGTVAYLYEKRPGANAEVCRALETYKRDLVENFGSLSEKNVSVLMEDYEAVVDYCISSSAAVKSPLSRSGMYLPFVNEDIISLCLGMVHPDKQSTVYLPFAGMAQFAENLPEHVCSGEELDKVDWALSQVRLDAKGIKNDIRLADSFLTSADEGRYDCIYAAPPTGRGFDLCRYILKTIKNKLIEGGEMVLILPKSYCYGSGGDGFDLRKTLIEKGYLEAVVGLPNGYGRFTSKQVAVFVIKKLGPAEKLREVSLVNVSEQFQPMDGIHRPSEKPILWKSVIEAINAGDESVVKTVPFSALSAHQTENDCD